jgi:transcriptional regulator with XRE-family HTH domain
MNKAKMDRLAKAGWTIGSTSDFLNLTPEESAYVEVKAALSKYVYERRIKNQWTQEKLAQMLKSSQSRVAKMECGDPSVSIDLLIRSLFVMGSTLMELAKAIENKPEKLNGKGSLRIKRTGRRSAVEVKGISDRRVRGESKHSVHRTGVRILTPDIPERCTTHRFGSTMRRATKKT